MIYHLRDKYLVCGFCVAAVLVAAAGEHWRSRPRGAFSPDALVVATTAEPPTLHPVLGSDHMSTAEILGAVFEPLTLYDDQHRLVPCLATELPSLENGGLRLFPDGTMESIWHLRPDACWSDGVPVTALDFVFTFHLIMAPGMPAPSREIEERIETMESRDDGRTLRVLWKKPYAFANEGHRHLLLPRHIEEPLFESLADKKDYEMTPFNRRPVGNGPYQVAEWAFGRYLVLKRQAHWHGPAPAFDEVIYRFIPEGETVLANLDTGRVGAVSPLALDNDLASEFELRCRLRGEDTYAVHHKPGLWWIRIDFNTENPLTADRRVRQALSAGLNRQGIARTLFPGQDCVTDTWLSPMHPAAFPAAGQLNPDLPRYPHDPDRASRLLDEAGWRLGPDRVRRLGGKSLRLPMTYSAGEPLTERIAQMVKEDWRTLGIELNLRPVDTRKLNESSAENRDYQGLSLAPWFMDPSADGITFWTSDNIPTDDRPNGQNTCRWRNRRSDDLLLRASETLDPKERRDLLWDQQRVWAEDVPAIPLFFQQEISISHRDLRGWSPTGTDTPITWNCYAWRWDKK